MIQTIKRLALPLIMILALAVLASEVIAAINAPHPVTGIGPAILVEPHRKARSAETIGCEWAFLL
jgi:hypothetical protein